MHESTTCTLKAEEVGTATTFVLVEYRASWRPSRALMCFAPSDCVTLESTDHFCAVCDEACDIQHAAYLRKVQKTYNDDMLRKGRARCRRMG